MAHLLQVPSDPGDPRGFGVGVERMFGHVVGEPLDDPPAAIISPTPWLHRPGTDTALPRFS